LIEICVRVEAPVKITRKQWQSWFWNALVFLALVYGVEAFQSRNLARGDLPNFLREESLPTLAGSTSSLWHPDQYTVVYIFAPWCGVCRASGSNIDQLPESFHKKALALSWETSEELNSFVSSTGLKVPVLLGKDREETALQVSAYPSYMIIDREGRIVKAWSGYTTTLGLWIKGYLARL
jgi:peroxiredoxin